MRVNAPPYQFSRAHTDILTSDQNDQSFSRLVDREGPFYQSRGKMRIRKRIQQSDWAALYGEDLFHSLVNAPTSRSICILLCGYLFMVILFGIPYYLISYYFDCNMDLATYHDSLFFSLETMATIGYGTSDIFFGNCWSVTFVLAAQICMKLIADAVIIGVIFSRLSRPSKRASTILFSQLAIIRRIRGKLYFMFQLCELRKHHLVEAHVRLYAIRHERGKDGRTSVSFQTCAMRLNHPNDEIGGMLLMCLPQLVVHEIDCASPLMPPPTWNSKTGQYSWSPPSMEHARCSGDDRPPQYDPDLLCHFPGIHKRTSNDPLQSPYRTRSTATATATFRGKDTPTSNTYRPTTTSATRRSQSLSHFQISQGASRQDGNGYDRVHAEDEIEDETDEPPFRINTVNNSSSNNSNNNNNNHSNDIDLSVSAENQSPDWMAEERGMISKYLADRRLEVVVLVEGVDAATGGVLQARHSYLHSEVVWNSSFSPCVYEDTDGSAVVDFSRFHDLHAVSDDADYMGDAASLI